MHFVITGGAGFIGSHLTEQLLIDGHWVTVVDHLTTGSLDNLPNHDRLILLQQEVSTCRPENFTRPVDGIAHLAATPSVVTSWEHPLEAHHNNLSATVAVIQLCQRLKVPKLIFASSAAVYGNQPCDRISEALSPQPISPYGLQKLVSEQYASLFAQHYGFAFVGLRLFNVFGPRQVPGSPYSGVISIFTDAMARGLPITIYGDGSQTRDFVYVKDVAQAFALALLQPMAAGSHSICNIGTGQAISLRQLVEELRQIFPESDSTLNFAPARVGDIQHSQAVVDRAMSTLGFVPEWSIRAGLRALAASLAAEEGTRAGTVHPAVA
jgi:UDP-glucose 4-epimerase